MCFYENRFSEVFYREDNEEEEGREKKMVEVEREIGLIKR